MSVDIAYPVLRTRDPGIALSTARQLVRLGLRPQSEVSMEAEVSSAARLRQIREAFPEVWCSSRTALSRPDPGAPDLARWLPGRPLPDDLTTVEGLLPITVSVLDQPAGRAEAGFAAPAGADMAEVCWSALSWPGVSTTR